MTLDTVLLDALEGLDKAKAEVERLQGELGKQDADIIVLNAELRAARAEVERLRTDTEMGRETCRRHGTTRDTAADDWSASKLIGFLSHSLAGKEGALKDANGVIARLRAEVAQLRRAKDAWLADVRDVARRQREACAERFPERRFHEHISKRDAFERVRATPLVTDAPDILTALVNVADAEPAGGLSAVPGPSRAAAFSANMGQYEGGESGALAASDQLLFRCSTNIDDNPSESQDNQADTPVQNHYAKLEGDAVPFAASPELMARAAGRADVCAQLREILDPKDKQELSLDELLDKVRELKERQ